VPVGPSEPSNLPVFSDFQFLPQGTEVILAVAPELDIQALRKFVPDVPGIDIRLVSGKMGRASQLNHGACKAAGEWLWFLHADSRFGLGQTVALRHAIGQSRDCLYYFNLWFLADGPKWMAINAAGVWIRSHVLRMPFGDQGFCISAKTFRRLGGFDESIGKGEDFAFVRHAEKNGIQLACTGGTLRTSARKYREQGWLRTTASHLLWTAAHLVPRRNIMTNTTGKGES
jgi:hypothetical protein